VLALGPTSAIGFSRFAYALLLPPMQQDLDWSYLLAGAMNTGNAFGYLLGALATPLLMRRHGAHAAMVGGILLCALFMLLSGFTTSAAALMLLRIVAGSAAAAVFIAGGLLAARLGAWYPQRAGLLIGLYYSGSGIGILLSALLVPATLAGATQAAHPWQWAWIVLGLAAILAALALIPHARKIDGSAAPPGRHGSLRWRDFGFGLAAYFLYGVGYIGYMTFVIALLKEQGMSERSVMTFYALLGLAVIGSSYLWAWLLDRFRNGVPLSILNALLGIATLLPAFFTEPAMVYLSGILFGAVFLSVVASTTALVRHNLPPQAWPGGIATFTIVFAYGQIGGPSLVGWIADVSGSLDMGLIVSAGILFAAAILALGQRALVSR